MARKRASSFKLASKRRSSAKSSSKKTVKVTKSEKADVRTLAEMTKVQLIAIMKSELGYKSVPSSLTKDVLIAYIEEGRGNIKGSAVPAAAKDVASRGRSSAGGKTVKQLQAMIRKAGFKGEFKHASGKAWVKADYIKHLGGNNSVVDIVKNHARSVYLKGKDLHGDEAKAIHFTLQTCLNNYHVEKLRHMAKVNYIDTTNLKTKQALCDALVPQLKNQLSYVKASNNVKDEDEGSMLGNLFADIASQGILPELSKVEQKLEQEERKIQKEELKIEKAEEKIIEKKQSKLTNQDIQRMADNVVTEHDRRGQEIHGYLDAEKVRVENEVKAGKSYIFAAHKVGDFPDYEFKNAKSTQGEPGYYSFDAQKQSEEAQDFVDNAF